MSKNIPVLMLLCCSVAVLALKKECPPKEETTCSCDSEGGLVLGSMDIFCSQLITVEDMNSNFTALRGYYIDRLTVQGINVPYVPEELYFGLHINHLILDRFEVKQKFRESSYFRGLEKTLNYLDIVNSFKRDSPLTHLKLDDLTQLKHLQMTLNKISKIGNDWFPKGPKSLKLVSLIGNGIENLGDKVFKSLEALEYLEVKGNSFSEVSRSMFPSPAPYLHWIDLSSNKIKKLPTGLFSDMPLLSSVLVGENLIHTISEEIFSSLQSVRHLSFEGNPLKCDSELKWVCRYKFIGECSSSNERGFDINILCKTQTYFL